MFPYFGRKARHASLYPEPIYPVIVEPFAGSMAWTLHHRPALGIGIERDPQVVDLWQRLTHQPAEYLPPDVGSRTDDLLVKLCSYSEHALTSGTMTVTSRMVRDWASVQRRIMDEGAWARDHIWYQSGSYIDAPDIEATWFIDPPYQYANRRGYAQRDLNYDHLAEWCYSRKGQIIVCEQEGADWMPFKRLADFASHRGTKSSEVIWLGDHHG